MGGRIDAAEPTCVSRGALTDHTVSLKFWNWSEEKRRKETFSPNPTTGLSPYWRQGGRRKEEGGRRQGGREEEGGRRKEEEGVEGEVEKEEEKLFLAQCSLCIESLVW